MNVTVLDITPPIANAGPDQIVNEGTEVAFNGSGSSDNVEIKNLTWTFIDGNQVHLYGEIISYLFNDPGLYVVTLNVSDEEGNWNTDTMNVTVKDVTLPNSDAGPDQTVIEGYRQYHSTEVEAPIMLG